FIFFFQAEDGIRDRNVTGVQTCALPISVFSNSTNKPKFVTELIIPVYSSPILSAIYSAFFKSSTSRSASIAVRSISDVCFATSGKRSLQRFIVLLPKLPSIKYVRIKRWTVKSGYLRIGAVKCV